MRIISRILGFITNQPAKQVCNYADNYYGDQVCRLTDKTGNVK